MNEIKLKINSWKKYQPQSDRIRHKYWFRINMDCALSHGLFNLSAEQRWFWIQVLCECCRKDSDIITIRVERFSKLCEISESSIISAINTLEENGTVSRLSVNCQKSVSPLSTHNITYITDKTDNITKDTKSCDSVSIKKPSKDSKKVGTDKVIAIYCSAYDSRYQARPEIDGKTIGLVKSLLKTHSPEKLSDLIKAYLQMDDPWFKTKNHDFPTFRENLTKISTAMQTGSNLSAEPKRPKIYHDELWKPWVEPDDRR